MRACSVVGVRPEFVLAMPIVRALAPDEGVLVHTGQHYDDALSNVFFDELALPPPAHELGVGSAPRAEQVARMRSRLVDVLRAETPDVVVVFGDTNSTLAGALAARDCGVPLAHVEAGVRSFDRSMPEERNRRRIDRLSNRLFAPTRDAVRNLRAAGVPGTVQFVGDVRRDAFDIVRGSDAVGTSVRDTLALTPGAYVLATVHRAANTDDPAALRSLLAGLLDCRPPVVLPLHPRTARRIREHGLEPMLDGLRAIDPVGYPAFLDLVANAGCVATDSGGVQREAMFAGTPCVTLRETTEWPETVWRGYNRLAGRDAREIRRGIVAAFREPVSPPSSHPPVAPHIVAALEDLSAVVESTTLPTDRGRTTG